MKAVLHVLDGITRDGGSLSGCLGLGAQWDRVLSNGLVWLDPRCVEILFPGLDMETLLFSRDTRGNLCAAWKCFASRSCWAQGHYCQDPGSLTYEWLRLSPALPCPCVCCDPAITPAVSCIFLFDAEFQKAWLQFFCRAGGAAVNVDEFAFGVVAQVEGSDNART